VKTALTLLIFAASIQAFAAVQNVQVNGAVSRVIGPQPIIALWGVMAGETDPSKTLAYNNCITALPDDSFTGCHEQRVNGNHVIVLQFTETEEIVQKAPVAYIEVAIAGGNGGTGGTGSNVNRRISGIRDPQAVRNGANQTGVIEFTWEDICNELQNGEGKFGTIETSPLGVERCEIDDVPVSGSIIVTFGFEDAINSVQAASKSQLTFNLYSPLEDSYLAEPGCQPTVDVLVGGSTVTYQKYGFCDIGVFPGDSGGTLRAVENFEPTTKLVNGISTPVVALDPFGTGNPQGFDLTVEQVRLYFSSINFESAHPSVASENQYADIFLDQNYTSGEPVIFREPNFGGLINDTAYIFRAATIDSSGYVSHLMARAAAPPNTATYCPDPLNATPATCPSYSMTPSEIAGIITESSCFITSATYGSPQADQVTLFRKFRSKYLWTNFFGRLVSNTYNKYGPTGAKWIYQNPSSKKFVRVGLYPFYGFAFLSVHYGFLAASAIYLLSLVVAVLGLIKILSKGKLQ
jgi:hypothetical protein